MLHYILGLMAIDKGFMLDKGVIDGQSFLKTVIDHLVRFHIGESYPMIHYHEW